VNDPRDQLQADLAERYLVERELGRGGMATVYLARDLKHDRSVALKVLLPKPAASLGPDRFQREIKLAARLQHPHILTVHDSGEAAGQLWFTMPYVEGESLRDRLLRERQLPVDEALRITREAALALDYAHQEGVVHRDIKPENLLLTKDGSTLVADFGIARVLGADEHLTQTGSSTGTPAYMSPEQANRDKAEAVRGKLSRLVGLDVIARGSSNQYRHTTKAPQEIAHELGADYLLTATVRWEKAPGGGSRVRVTPELVEVEPGRAPRARWQDSFDASLADVFQVQADIATTVAAALNVALGDSERRDLAAQPTQSLAAYDAFLKGEAASQSMGVSLPASLRPAIGFYEQAVALDSSFVTAWAQLARARSLLYVNSTPTPELAAQARQAAEAAIPVGSHRTDEVAGGSFSWVPVLRRSLDRRAGKRRPNILLILF
jgi:TolB-like protein/predicted Ser/Thr protein kinase